MMKNKCICRAKDIHVNEWIYGYYVSKIDMLNGCFCVKYDNHNNPAIDMLCDYEISGDVFDNTELMEG